MKILVVDDNDSFRSDVSNFLSEHKDFDVVGEAKDGLEAISLAQLLQPDLILLDISMPRMNGFEAAQKIKDISPGTRRWPNRSTSKGTCVKVR